MKSQGKVGDVIGKLARWQVGKLTCSNRISTLPMHTTSLDSEDEGISEGVRRRFEILVDSFEEACSFFGQRHWKLCQICGMVPALENSV